MAFGGVGGFEPVGCARTPNEARELLSDGADVALVEAELDGHDGVALVEELLHRHPEVRFIIVSARRDPRLLERALAAGASGFIPKSTSLREFISWVQRSLDDHAAIPASLLAEMHRNKHNHDDNRERGRALRSHLTPRELEVLGLISTGISTREIAERLVVSETTVRSHVQHLLAKLNVHSRMEAVNYARSLGLIGVSERTV